MLLGCGIPIERPALGVNRLCGSGFQAIVNGAQDILLGAAKIALTGGVDSMSLAPFIARNIRFGTIFGSNYALEDSLWVNCDNGMSKRTPIQLFFNVSARINRLILQTTHGIDSRETWRTV